jgi:ATP diphosphatase
MAREAGRFDFGDVVEAICEKLVDRHPHVFGDAVVESASAQTDAWERRKAEERARAGASSAADGVPLALPALLRARKLLSRAQRAGFESPQPAQAQARPESAEAHGARLLDAAARAQRDGVDPEQALRDAVARFEQRLRDWEASRATRPA